MARTVTPLTNTEVKQAKASGKVKTLRDGGGLELRVSPTGSKSWILNIVSRLLASERILVLVLTLA